MIRRYSEWPPEQLTEELERLQREMADAQTPVETEVLRQKYYMAKAYLLKDRPFPKGLYRVEGREETFTLERLNGIMAWGKWENGEEGAVPISALVSK
ncbi:DUF1811 family protein [Paenibacillus alkalitolerans]|uniref:DUF1811 family protein n=1 Tax=Paenibacillus alkalitolerans TaxID=2799335 RepID=UPI0018F70C3D|nr:DUF1811 family protein [Paenibacillus alkalitolerans]